MKADHYDGFAESYSTENDTSLINGYYEPAGRLILSANHPIVYKLVHPDADYLTIT